MTVTSGSWPGRGRGDKALTHAAVLAILAAALSACASIPAPRTASCADTVPPPIASRADGREHTTLDVMTYNIEGLHWPARAGRSADLEQIGQRLAALRASGNAPDVIVFQEMFSKAARHAVRSSGYPSEVAGPSQFKSRDLPSDGQVPGHRSWRRGEFGVRLASGGLAIVSRYPITAHKSEPFGHHACAGMDCLSNKGALFAELSIPGVPEPVQVFDSHMNSRHASRAPSARAAASHALEAEELADFIAARGDRALPTVLAGDFNVRHSPSRFAALAGLTPLTLVHRWCLDHADACDVRMDWADATPWLDTEDLQFFQSGRQVSMRPIRVETLFDGKDGGPVLSDHVAFRVVYDLSWPAAPTVVATTRTTCPAASDTDLRKAMKAL